MFSHRHYVPIVKAKRGELFAYRDLTDEARERITPLFDVPFASDHAKKSHEQQLIDGAETLAEYAPSDHPFFVDFGLLKPDRRIKGAHPVTFYLSKLRETGAPAIPVIGLRRDTAYRGAVTAAVREDGRGFAVRLADADFGDSELEAALDSLLDEMQQPTADVDLVVDLERIEEGAASRTAFAVRGLLASLPRLDEWRTLTLAMTSFPNLADLQVKKGTAVSRTDWAVYTSIVTNPQGLSRLPAFGDYGMDTPGMIDFDPVLMSAGVNLRYTTEDEYVIIKGGSFKKQGGAPFKGLCQVIIKERGALFDPSESWADAYVQECASGGKTGNPETWRRIGTNRHFTVVSRQIASLP